MKNFALPLIALLVAATSAFAADDDAKIDEVIRRARSFVGDEAKIDSIKSLHYKGSLLYSTGDLGTIEIVYQKPLQQKIIAVINETKEISALDDTEGWITYTRLDLDQPLSMEIFDPLRILAMQAGVRDALAFFARPTKRNSAVTYEGTEIVKGHECDVLTYDYGDGFGFQHFFDTETGELLKTLDSKGVVFTREGEIEVEGLRFPQKLISAFPTDQGEQTMEFSYTLIEINKTFPDSEFKVPPLF